MRSSEIPEEFPKVGTLVLFCQNYNDVMSAMAYQITGVPSVYLIVCSGIDQTKHKSSASLAFGGWGVRGGGWRVGGGGGWSPVTKFQNDWATGKWLTYEIPQDLSYVVPFEVWEWISNFTPHFIGHVITYPCSSSSFRWYHILQQPTYMMSQHHPVCGAPLTANPKMRGDTLSERNIKRPCVVPIDIV